MATQKSTIVGGDQNPAIAENRESDLRPENVKSKRVASNSNSSTSICMESGPITEVHFANEEDGMAKRYLVNVKKVGQEKWHLCSYCSKAFKKPSDLIRHIRTHTLERPYKCPQCFKAFAVKSTLNTHAQTHSTEKRWKCRHCHKAFSVLTTLRTHERLHSNIKLFKCAHDGCGKTFKTSSLRRSHMKVHNRNTMNMTGKRKLLRIGEGESNKKKADFPDALKITPNGLVSVPTRCALSSTAKNPGDAKCRPYRCPRCPSAFKKSSHLKQHILSHTGEKPYQCFQCNRRFVSSGVLKNHIKTHQGIRPYKCDVCQISFTTTGSLKRHKATHSNNRPYLCPFCKKSFKTNVSCRKHIRIHCRGDVVTLNEKPIIVKVKPKEAPVVPSTVVSKLPSPPVVAPAPTLSSNIHPITIQVSTTNVPTSMSVNPVTINRVPLKLPVNGKI